MTISRSSCYIRAYIFFLRGNVSPFLGSLILRHMTTCGLLSRSWIILRTLLHRRSWRTVTKETRRLSAVKNIIGDLSIASERILITFYPRPTARKLNIFPTRLLRIVSSRWNYARLHLYAFIFRFKTDSCTNIQCRIFVSDFTLLTSLRCYFQKLSKKLLK